MAEQSLAGKRIAVLATDGVEDSELQQPVNALRDAGAQVWILAPSKQRITTFRHLDPGTTVPVDGHLHEANADDYDAVFLPGGALNADSLRADPQAVAFVQKIQAAGKPIAAICHAPWLLVSADLVRGRHLTSYHTIQDDIRNAGGSWEDRTVLVDRNWVTSRQPADLPVFIREMIALFQRETKSGRRAA